MTARAMKGQCACGHALDDHDAATPNRDLKTCRHCLPALCIVHQAFQPAGTTRTHTR